MSLLLLVAVVSHASPIKVAAPDFTLVGLDATLGAIYQDRLLGRFASKDLQVTTARDVQQLLGLERQRQLLGCASEGSSCMAELAGALGVDAVLTGSIAKTESGFLVSLRLLRSGDAQPLSTPNTSAATEKELLGWLDETAGVLRTQLLRAFGVEVATAPPSGVWVPAIVGGVLLAGAAACLSISGANYAALTGSSPPPEAQISSVRMTGETLLPVGIVLAGLGAIGIASSVVWNALTPKNVQAALVPTRDGFALSFGGAFP